MRRAGSTKPTSPEAHSQTYRNILCTLPPRFLWRPDYYGESDNSASSDIARERKKFNIHSRISAHPRPPRASSESSHKLPRIFEPLVRGAGAEHPKRNRPGSIGLGLYIAREVARSHGGKIDVTSSQEAGTAFTMHLPRHPLVKSDQPILDEKHVQTM